MPSTIPTRYRLTFVVVAALVGCAGCSDRPKQNDQPKVEPVSPKLSWSVTVTGKGIPFGLKLNSEFDIFLTIGREWGRLKLNSDLLALRFKADGPELQVIPLDEGFSASLKLDHGAEATWNAKDGSRLKAGVKTSGLAIIGFKVDVRSAERLLFPQAPQWYPSIGRYEFEDGNLKISPLTGDWRTSQLLITKPTSKDAQPFHIDINKIKVDGSHVTDHLYDPQAIKTLNEFLLGKMKLAEPPKQLPDR